MEATVTIRKPKRTCSGRSSETSCGVFERYYLEQIAYLNDLEEEGLLNFESRVAGNATFSDEEYQAFRECTIDPSDELAAQTLRTVLAKEFMESSGACPQRLPDAPRVLAGRVMVGQCIWLDRTRPVTVPS